ncbi:MAG: hypothetical protein IKT40_11560 [Bacilli bacterium]|nr:hypothetical protein [Bacilli bacterium]
MWVLMNDKGQVITSIPHGEIIRQGSSFSISVAFEKEYFYNILGRESVIYSSYKFLTAIEEKIHAQFTFEDFIVSDLVTPQLIKFKKVKPNESICSFEEGKTYVVYKFDGSSSHSEKEGEKSLVLKLNFMEEVNGNISIKEEKTLGAINLYIEKTYGQETPQDPYFEDRFTLMASKFQNLLSKKLDIKEEKVKLLEEEFDSIHSFSEYCCKESRKNNEDKIYFGKVDEDPTIAICSLNGYALVLGSNGLLAFANGDGNYYSLVMPNLTIENAQINKLNMGYGSIDATGGKVLVAEPTESEHAASKYYVDVEIFNVKEFAKKEIADKIAIEINKILGGELEESTNSLYELLALIRENEELIKNNKDIINQIQSSLTKFNNVSEGTIINQILEPNNDYIYTSKDVFSVKFTIPSTIEQGYMSAFSIKIGSEVPTITFNNVSPYRNMLFTLNGSQRKYSKIIFQPNQTLLGGIMFDGINIYVYLKEMKNESTLT